MGRLYPWTHADLVAKDEILQHKHVYLNTPFFLVRAALYFAVWNGISYFLNAWSLEQDQTGDPRLSRRMQTLSAAGLLGYGLTITFASFDWLMSIDPHWFSTIYGVLIIGGQGLTAIALLIVVIAWLSRREPLDALIVPGHFHDAGNLMLAFVMLWAYFSFSQYLIIWSGDLPHEIAWYQDRLQTGWRTVGVAAGRRALRRAVSRAAVAAGQAHRRGPRESGDRHPGRPPDRSVLAHRAGVSHARPVRQLARHPAAGLDVGVLARLLRLAAARPRHPPGLRSRVRGDHGSDHSARRRTAGDGAVAIMSWQSPSRDERRRRQGDPDGGRGLAAGTIVVAGRRLAARRLPRLGDRRQTGPREFPLAVTHEQRLPPEPRLQTNPREDLADLRRAEDRVLDSYGWVDKDAGIVRIPIDEAMRLTVERGLPARGKP